MHLLKNTFITLLFVALSSNLFAQSPQDILNNPDISWVAEAYTYYAPSSSANSLDLGKEKMKELYNIEGRNSARLLKLVDVLSDDNLYASQKELATFMFNLDASKVKVYNSSDLEMTYTAQEYQNKKSAIDTIITFDPTTYEEIVQVIVSAFDERTIQVFTIKQLLYYNNKTKQLGCMPIAIAPMLPVVNDRGETRGYTELFWLAVKENKKALKLTKSIYNYAIRMTRNIHEKDMKVVKGDWTLGQVIKDMVAYGNDNPSSLKFYHNIGMLQPMTEDEVANLSNNVDTIITFDPETFEEIIQVARDEFDVEDIKSLRLVQDWVWDNKKQMLNIRLLAMAPIRQNKDKKFKRLIPLFYQKAGE